MKCPTCNGKGFTELEHGLIQVSCPDCINGEIPDGSSEETLSDIVAEADAFANALMPKLEGELNDSNSRVKPDNQPVGSNHTSKPKLKRKSKKNKVA